MTAAGWSPAQLAPNVKAKAQAIAASRSTVFMTLLDWTRS
jgi:hypothetical protein